MIIKKNKGFYTIEAIVAIVIFAIGILGVLKIQASSISNVTDGQYRTVATSLSENIIGYMTLDAKNLDEYLNENGQNYEQWLAQVKKSLPGVENNPPEITQEDTSYGKNIKISIYWTNPANGIISKYETQTTLY